MILIRHIKDHFAGIALLVLCVVAGCLVNPSVGISWDEEVQRQMGLVSYRYVFEDNSELLTYLERDHGVGFELPLILAERLTGITDSRDIYLQRHLLTHLFFLLGCFGGYVLVYKLFKSKLLACLGFLMLVMHPRIYAHSFFNSKDIPLLSAYLLSLLCAYYAFEKKKAAWFFAAGMVCGYTCSIRVIGIILPLLISAILLSDIIMGLKRKAEVKPLVFRLLALAGGTAIALYICFPYLWGNPVVRLTEVFNSLSHFRWINPILLAGNTYMSDALPWFYLPVWISVTTPLIWLLLAVAGLGYSVISLARKLPGVFERSLDRNLLLYLLTAVLPVVAIIAFRSIVYDDWRHVYFIYPSMVLLAIGVINAVPNNRVRGGVVGLAFVQFIFVVVFLANNHCYGQVYFNELVSRKPEHIRKNYEQDYWGSSTKRGLEFILQHDTSSVIRVFGREPVRLNTMILTAAQRKRIQFTDDRGEAHYFITNFRDDPSSYERYPAEAVKYEVNVQNSTIMRVYYIKTQDHF